MPLFVLPKIYPITDVRISGIPHAEQFQKLIHGGSELIQIREKHFSPRDFYESAEAALAVARQNKVRIVINDRVDIALALKADGVHLGQDDLPPEYARRILGPDAIIGFSTHSVRQAVEALHLPIDYIAIGPIFLTKTKANPDLPLGIDGLVEVRKATGDFPLVAIGGITSENFKQVLNAGADSAAMIGDLISDPGVITQKMRQLLHPLN